jgi:hypothetical protein
MRNSTSRGSTIERGRRNTPSEFSTKDLEKELLALDKKVSICEFISQD